MSRRTSLITSRRPFLRPHDLLHHRVNYHRLPETRPGNTHGLHTSSCLTIFYNYLWVEMKLRTVSRAIARSGTSFTTLDTRKFGALAGTDGKETRNGEGQSRYGNLRVLHCNVYMCALQLVYMTLFDPPLIWLSHYPVAIAESPLAAPLK